MSKVFYQLSSQGGVPSPCPLTTYGNLQLHLVALPGGKTRGEQIGPAVSTPSCAAVHRRCVLHEGWDRRCTWWSLPTEQASGVHVSTTALEEPSATHPLQSRGLCSPLLCWLGGLCGHHIQPHSPTMFFFLSKQGLAQPNQIIFLSPPAT